MIASDFDKGGAATGPNLNTPFDITKTIGYQTDQYQGLMWLFLGLM